MIAYAEHYNILSISQEDISSARRTALHDANCAERCKIEGEDIYLMYTKCSSAFNTIDHGKLLISVYDPNVPTKMLKQPSCCMEEP